MVFGKRSAYSSAALSRGRFRPVGEHLEARIALAGNSIDLANVATNPYGIQENGFNPGQNLGLNVAYVGNVNNNNLGYDDFLVSGPNSTGVGSQVYLVFGSQDAVAGNLDWRTLNTTGQRVGSIGVLGTAAQPNGYNFDGIAFTSSDPNTTGATVAAVNDVNGDGIPDFMIGFPNADGGAGRAYLVLGSSNLTTDAHNGSAPINLDSPPSNLTVITFRYATPANALVSGSHTGTAMGSVPNFFGDGNNAIVIGAPDSNVGVQLGGAVYAVPATTFLNAPNNTVLLDTLGQTQTAGFQTGLVFTGANIGERAGRSVAGLTSFDGTTGPHGLLGDLAIGAPALQEPSDNITGPGSVYLVYGAANLNTFAILNSNNVTAISLASLNLAGGPVGATFVGQSDGTGFSVSSGGDFNNDGFTDLLIGAPINSNSTGLVSLIYGRAASSTLGRITGTVPLSSIPAGISSVQFQGAGQGAQAGWSVSQVGKINSSTFNPILIGSPGFLNNAGIAYLIPGQATLTGTQLLSAALSDPIDATVITNSTPAPSGGIAANRLGASVSGRLTALNARTTLDNDLIGDFVIGAPQFTPATATSTSGIATAGAVFALEGDFVPLSIPTPVVQIPAVIVVGTVATATPPYPVSASSASLTFLVLDTTVAGKPVLHPVRDINPATITVNGVTYTGNQIKFVNAGPLTGNGIDDAQITVTPQSLLNLKPGLQTLTVTGITLASSPNPLEVWGGTTTIRVTTSPVVGPGGNPVSTPLNNPFFSLFFPSKFNFVPPFGEALIPTVNTLSKLTWKPIGYRVAFNQFLPTKPFATRFQNFFNPVKTHPLGSKNEYSGSRTSTLGRRVFTRGRIKPGTTVHFTHSFPVIPPNLQSEGLPRKK